MNPINGDFMFPGVVLPNRRHERVREKEARKPEDVRYGFLYPPAEEFQSGKDF